MGGRLPCRRASVCTSTAMVAERGGMVSNTSFEAAGAAVGSRLPVALGFLSKVGVAEVVQSDLNLPRVLRKLVHEPLHGSSRHPVETVRQRRR